MPKTEISISDEGKSKEKKELKGKFGKGKEEKSEKSESKFEDKPANEKISSEVADQMKNQDHFAPHLDHPQVKSSYPGDKITGKK